MISNDKQAGLFRAFAKANDAIAVKELEIGFIEAANAYRQVVTKFIDQAPTDEHFVREIKRRTAENILSAAHRADQPFEVCQEIWNELVGLGFTNNARKEIMSWIYADSCLDNARFDEGLAVLEPVIAEVEQKLRGMTIDPEIRVLRDRDLARLTLLRDGLIAFRTGEAEASAWEEREERELAAWRASDEEKYGKVPDPPKRGESVP